MSKSYKIYEGSLHERFQASRGKVQLFGGGFGNGKTTAAVIKALQLAKEYPGSNGLIARATFPKLMSTIRKVFLEWCPPSWIKRNVSSGGENLVELINGSVINFSYVSQQGKAAESSTSNLLSATYDYIVIDQLEDPEISEKDFMDLLGRLRGNATYVGDDDTMPSSGPRWLIAMCNPTRNWVYRKLVKPLHDLEHGIRNPALLTNADGSPMVELYEGSTYDNKENLPEDFITTLEGAYKGQMKSRFLLGEWGAYEGLVYPQYDANVHLIQHDEMEEHFNELYNSGMVPNILEAYDHGIAAPACYGFAYTDMFGNTFLLDGFYQKEQTIAQLAHDMKEMRKRYGYTVGNLYDDDELEQHLVLADPAVFKRASGNSRTVGTTTSGLFREHGIRMGRANNDILNGISKVQSYLTIDPMKQNPFTGNLGSPSLFISTKCDWFDREIVDYYWKKDTAGEYEDVPVDRNDHAMDMLKYLLTNKPKIAGLLYKPVSIPKRYTRWSEHDIQERDGRNHRHG